MRVCIDCKANYNSKLSSRCETCRRRAQYRARNPLPPCQVCGQLCARRNQTECDNCCPNLAQRQAHRERERLRGIRRRAQAAKETP